MKSPGAHQRLDRGVECPAGRRAERSAASSTRRPGRGRTATAAPAGAAVQLREVAGVVEQRERALDPPELGQGGLRRLVARGLDGAKSCRCTGWPIAHDQRSTNTSPATRRSGGRKAHAARKPKAEQRRGNSRRFMTPSGRDGQLAQDEERLDVERYRHDALESDSSQLNRAST